MHVNAYWTTGCAQRIFLSVWGQTTADILISCPVFGKAVPTGIIPDHIILGSLNFAFTMQCPPCRKTHKRSRTDAWIEEARRDRKD
jgi:hypothetical protein